MKTGDEVFERSTGAKGTLLLFIRSGDNMYCLVFKNGRPAIIKTSLKVH